MVGDCKMAPWAVVRWSGHGSMVVRGFCCVKFGAVGIPAFAGMTLEGVGMTLVGAGMTLVGAGMMWEVVGMTWEVVGMAWEVVGMTWARERE